MAEVFSTIAGVASLIDVALRACNVLYDSGRYLRDAPQLSQRLRRTIQSLEFALQSLKQFVAHYRQQQILAGLPDHLPGAINEEIVSIKANLDALTRLLPASSLNGQMRTKFKWVLDRKKVTEVLQALDSHQITLLVALQSFAQRNGIQLHDDVIQRLENIHRHQQDTAKNLEDDAKILREELVPGNAKLHTDLNVVTQTAQALLPAQESLKSGLFDLHKTVSTGQTTILDKINALGSSLSETQIRSNHVASSTVLTVPTEDVLARVFRAELQRVIMPTVQQCFDTFKANSDPQLDEIRQQIDQMAQQLGSRFDDNGPGNVKPSHTPSTSQANGSAPTHVHHDSTDMTTSHGLATSPSSVSNHSQSQKYQKWSWSWVFSWKIGTLRVTISTTVTKRNISYDYRAGGVSCPQKSYRVTVHFIPAQSLIHFRGLELSVESKSDQRGYYQICPFLSTFAVVPDDADVFKFVWANDVEGIQDLFQKGLAAPTDRDTNGGTLLMTAVANRCVDTCRLLLNEGSDPLVTTRDGLIAADFAVLSYLVSLEDSNLMVLIQLLQQANYDTMEATFASQNFLVHWITISSADFSPHYKLSKPLLSPYIQQLRQLGFRLDTPEEGRPVIFKWIHSVQFLTVMRSPGHINRMLQTLLSFGADIYARWYGLTPLQYLFVLHRRFEADEEQYRNTIEMAVVLLEHGADPYALTDSGFSIFDFAKASELTCGLDLALQRTGYDPDEVRYKIDMARRLIKNPGEGVAKSTAVDNTHLLQPSTASLVSRRIVAGDRLED
ncbi:MAG: hypothetical protein Q9226_001287 [Calogaya cf. arnoldii]